MKTSPRAGCWALRLEALEPRVLLAVPALDAGLLAFLDQQAEQFDGPAAVYTEADAGGNLYAPSGLMNTTTSGVLALDPASGEQVDSGQTALKVAWTGAPGDDGQRWAGFFCEWPAGLVAGSTPLAPGWDLSQATSLSFRAISPSGPEGVQVGVGAAALDGFEVRQWITVGNAWQTFTLDLTGRDLSNLNAGFLVAFNDAHDLGATGAMVYFDDIRFNAPLAPEPGAAVPHRLIQSYTWADNATPADATVYRNTAYTYDNALAALAYMAAGQWQRAGELVDAFHWLLHHEQIDPGLEGYVGPDQAFLRSGYRCGPIRDPATDRPREAGWTDASGLWHSTARSITTGNNAWAMIALLNYYAHSGDAAYLDDARLIGNWLHANWHDAANGGYLMGLGMSGLAQPWPGKPKSTEHNLDVAAAFALLAAAYDALGDTAARDLWQARADDAASFALAMHLPADGRFRIGTTPDGVTPDDSVLALDVQTWAVLALGTDPAWAGAIDWTAPLAWAEAALGATVALPGGVVADGFDFGKASGQAGEPDGVWLEGTAQMAAAYGAIGHWASADHCLWQLAHVQALHPDGDGQGLVAAGADGLSTGFGDAYNARLHIGATAWALLANAAYNPFAADYLPAPQGMSLVGAALPSWWHDEFEGQGARESLDALAATWSNVVEVVPTWYQATAASTAIAPDATKTATDAGVRAIIQRAHAAGLQVLLKPHVDVLDGTWRGYIAPADAAAWFSSYRDFILHYAAIAEQEGVELLAVGTELVSLSGAAHAAHWDGVLDAIEATYSGELVYAANHDEYEDVAFWDRLDYVGLDAYFDFAAAVPAVPPACDDLRAAWDPIVAGFTAWLAAERPDGRALITELGYRSIADAHVRPWESWRAGTYDGDAQAACYRAALEAWSGHPWLVGVVFWTWPTDLTRDIPTNVGNTGYSPYNKPAEAVLREFAMRARGGGVSEPLPDVARDASELSWNFPLDGVFAGFTPVCYSVAVSPGGLTAEVAGSTLTIASAVHRTGAWSVEVTARDAGGRELTDEFLLVLTDDAGGADRVVWDLAANAAGELLVVWSDGVWVEGTGRFAREVRGQRFGAGGEPLGPPTVLATSTTQWFSDVHAALSDAGTFAVAGLVAPTRGAAAVWPFDSTTILTPNAAWVQFFRADGLPMGGRLTVSAWQDAQLNNLDLAMDAAGNAVVVWDQRFGAADKDVACRLYRANGLPATGRLIVGGQAGDQRDPSVAFTSDGGFVVAWSEWAGGGPWRVVAQRYSARGVRVGNKFQALATDFGERPAPLVAAGAPGFVVAAGAQAQRFDAAGLPVGGVLEFAHAVRGLDADASGYLLVNGDLYGPEGALMASLAVGDEWLAARLSEQGRGAALYAIGNQAVARRWDSAGAVEPGGLLATGRSRELAVPLARPWSQWSYTEPDGAQVILAASNAAGEARFEGARLAVAYWPIVPVPRVSGAATLRAIALQGAAGGVAFRVWGGDGLATLGELTGDAALGYLAAGRVDLTGGAGIALAGGGSLASAVLHSIGGGAGVAVAGSLNYLRCDAGLTGSVEAARIGTLDVRGGLAGAVVSPGEIGAVRAFGGDISDPGGAGIRAGGRIGAVQVVRGSLWSDVTSLAGSVGNVSAIAQFVGGAWVGGGIGGSVRAGGDVVGVYAFGGDVAGGVASLGGRVFSVRAQAAYDWATGAYLGGGVSGAVAADGDLYGVYAIGGDITGGVASARGRVDAVVAQALWSPRQARLWGGDIEGVVIRADAGRVGLVSVGGRFYNASVSAAQIGSVRVAGLIEEEAGDGEDELHALSGRFFVRDRSNWPGQWVGPGAEALLGGVRCYVG